jgi:hypothetical protein
VLELLAGPEQAVGARQPAAGNRDAAAREVVQGQLQGHEARPDVVARRHVRGVAPLADRHGLLEVARPPCRLRQLLEIVGRQAVVRVRAAQKLVRVAPRAAASCLPACCERVVDDLSHAFSDDRDGVWTAPGRKACVAAQRSV